MRELGEGNFFTTPQLHPKKATLRAQHQQVEKHANIETLARALSHRRVHEKIIAEGWSCALIFVTRHPSDLRVMLKYKKPTLDESHSWHGMVWYGKAILLFVCSFLFHFF